MSVNPLKPYALQEIQRCTETKRFSGLKLHFANSQVNLFDSVQVKQLQKVFALANKNHLPMLIHFRSAQKWNGRANALVLVKRLMPYAKNTTVVIAHLAGWGGYDKAMDSALAVITSYLCQTSRYSKNLYLELSAVLPLSLNEDYHPARLQTDWNALVALNKRIREIGIHRILFGTDWPLIDIGPYIQLLNGALGKDIVQEILQNKVMVH